MIGVTCGLSAPYCAGQIDYAMDQVELVRVQSRAVVVCMCVFVCVKKGAIGDGADEKGGIGVGW